MPPLRAPSLDLLRILRQTTSPLSHTHTRPKPNLTCPFQRPYHSSAPKHLKPTQSHADNTSKPKPSTYPPTSAPAPASPSASSSKVNPFAPSSHDRGPTSKEDTQTDFGVMDIYANVASPATSIDACTPDGFHLDNGIKVSGFTGLIVAGGEAWSWRPWLALQNQNQSQMQTQSGTGASPISVLLDARRGILTIPKQSLGLFAMLHPKPDLLLLGTGSRLWMLAPETKRYLMEELGVRVDVMDTGNASAAYNLLAKERGVEGGAGVGGAFLPIGWKGPDVGKARARRR